MSPRMPANSSARQAEKEVNIKTESSEMIRMLEGNLETPSDWQEDFLLAVHGDPNLQENDKQEENATNENTQVIQEFQVPISQEFLPDGSVTVAFNDTWSQQQVSAPSVELFHDYTFPPELQTAPSLYVVEGKEDPEDEGICVVSPSPPMDESGLLLPPPPTSPSPVLTFSQVTPPPPSSASTITTLQPSTFIATAIKPSQSPSPEKQFFEQHSIMKWVIDDGDESDIPELSHPPASVSSPRSRPGISGLRSPASQSSASRQVRVISSTATSSKSQETVIVKPKTEMKEFVDTFKSEDSDKDWEPTQFPTNRRRKRGRPLDHTPRSITAKLPRMKRKSSATSDSDLSFSAPAYHSDSASGLTDEEVSALKYRRMRDLNNEASRRCRENRKQKKGEAEAELNALKEKNLQLRQTVEDLETKVSRLKRKFLITMKKPSREIALARQRQLGQSLNISPEFVGSFIAPDADIKPELDSFWSS